MQVLLEKGIIKCKQPSDLDYMLVCAAKAICRKAVTSPKWKQLGMISFSYLIFIFGQSLDDIGCSADNTSCIVVALNSI